MSQLRRTRKEMRKKKAKRGKMLFFLLALLLVASAALCFVFLTSSPTKEKASTPSSKVVPTTSSKKEVTQPSKPKEKSWSTVSKENYLPIAMFHNVDNTIKDNNWMTPETLESDLKALKEKNYYTVTPQEATRILTEEKRPQEKMIWLRFDDSKENFYTNVFPLLKKYKMKATSFVITGKVGQKGSLTKDQILEMVQSGLVSFESHTVNHLDLRSLDQESQKSELEGSKNFLDKLLKQDTTVICYPSGAYNETTIQVAKELGYKLGLTTKGGFAANSDGLFELTQIRMGTLMNGENLLSSIAPALDEKR